MFGANIPARWRRGILLLALLLTTALLALGLRWQAAAPGPRLESPYANSTLIEPDKISGPRSQPGPGGSAQDGDGLLSLDGYWKHRLTYPAGNYDPSWLLQAAQQDSAVPRAVPAGQITYNHRDTNSPLTLDPLSWTALGPKPEVGGFGDSNSGRVSTIAIDPVTPNVAYIGVAGGGIWKTTNCCSETTSWTLTTDSPLLGTTAVSDITIDPHSHTTLYATTGDVIFGYLYSGVGIFKSTDAGANWTLLDSPISQYRGAGKVRVDPHNSNTVVIGTKDGVFLSYDAGQNWTGSCLTNSHTDQGQEITGLILRDNGAFTDMVVAVGSAISNNVAIGNMINGADGIYTATIPLTGCPSQWNLVSTPTNGWPAGTGSGIPFSQGGNRVGRIDLAMAPSNSNYIYAQAESMSTLGQLGLWRTTDAGSTWEQRSAASALIDCANHAGDYIQNWWDQGVAIDPGDPNTLFMDTVTVYKSTDGGASFTDVACSLSGGNVHPDQHALSYMPGSPNVLLAANDGGIYFTDKTNDPRGNWHALNDSLNTIEFYGGDITANFAISDTPGIIGGAQDNGTSAYQWDASATPGPAPWQMTFGGDGIYARIEPVLGQRWYMEYQYGNLFVSKFGPFGPPQEAAGSWLGPERRSFYFPYQIYKNDCPPDTGCQHLIAGTNRVWETLEGAVPASSWYTNSLDLTKNINSFSYINQLNFAVSISSTVIVGTNDGNVQYGFHMGEGVPMSATWVNVTGGNAVLPNRPIFGVTTDPVNPLIGYASIGGFDQNTPSTPGHVFMVTCTASCASFTWANKTGNLPDIPLNTIIANPRFPQQVFVGSDWGLYYTNDISQGTPVWFRFNAGLPDVMIWDMSIDRGSTTLALWTRSRGAYAWPLPSGPVVPTPTVTGTPPTNTPTSTATNTPTTTPTTIATATGTSTQTSIPTSTSVPSGTATSTSVPTITSTPCTITFTDVSPSDYFYVPVQYLYCHGAISGYADNTFRPSNNTTRGQVSKIVVLAEGWTIYTPPSPTFSDVPADHPFYQYIETAYSHGIISGYADGTFKPGNNVTRGQLCKIVVLAEGWQLYNPPTPTFTDVPTDHPFYTYIETAYSHGIISGYGTVFLPSNSATRGQISKIIYNAVTAP